MGRLAELTALTLLALGAGCAPDERRDVDGVARAILDVPPTESIVPVPVPARAWESACQMEPVRGNLARRLELVELVEVHMARVRSDRGEELVRIHGLGGPDERLPEAVNAYLRGPALEAMGAWLNAPEWELVELSPERFVSRGAVAGPDLADLADRRVISIGRRERGRPADDLGSVALREGWAWPCEPGEDPLALDPRWPFFLAAERAGGTRGVNELPEVQALVEEYRAEAAALAEMGAEELEARGRALTDEVAGWLGWTPREPLTFVARTPDQAGQPLRDALEASRRRTLDCLEMDARRMENLSRARGSELTVQLDLELPPLEEELEQLLASAHAFSPAGPTIWIVQRADLSEPLFRLVLVREILKQYQEECLSRDGGYPVCGLPNGLEEAHAARLAAYHLRHGEGVGRVDGDPRAFRLYGLVSEELGLGLHGLFEGLVDGKLDAGLWRELVEGRVGLQEWLFREAGRVDRDGLRFQAVRSPDYLPRVRITNEGARRFDGQFHGQWLWTVEGGGRTIATLSGAPLNLGLAPGGTIVLELAREPHWRELPPARVTGLYSITRRAPPLPAADAESVAPDEE